MTTAKKTTDLENPVTTTAPEDFNFIEISNSDVDSCNSDVDSCKFEWNGEVFHNEKQKLATDILMRLLDFNLRELSRTDVDTVQVFENPAQYAAKLTNELFDNIE